MAQAVPVTGEPGGLAGRHLVTETYSRNIFGVKYGRNHSAARSLTYEYLL